jgi:anaerobic magnesium-protoporphyrin IX monomethyl ester cyclase
MNKILIVKPPYEYLPMSIAYVLGCLEKNNIPFDYIDTYLECRKITELLDSGDYSVIASGGHIKDIQFFEKLTHEISSSKNKVPYILGGKVAVDMNSALLFSNLKPDYLLRGEAENSLPELYRYITFHEGQLEDISGVSWVEDGNVKHCRIRRYDLGNNNPVPAYHLMDISRYMGRWTTVSELSGTNIIPVLTGRDCYGKCRFCAQQGSGFRGRKVDDVLSEMKYYYETYRPDAFVFSSDILFSTEDEILEFCRKYSESDFCLPWSCQVKADLSREVLEAMKGANCQKASIGLESGSDRILELMKKEVATSDLQRVINDVRELGIDLHCFSLTAFEGETLAETRETYEFLLSNEVFSIPNLTSAYPGTSIFKQAKVRGLVKDEWEYARVLEFKSMLTNEDFSFDNYINISALDDEHFYQQVYGEFRRYMYKAMDIVQADDLQISTDIENQQLVIHGKCKNCGHHVERRVLHGSTDINYLSNLYNCLSCQKYVYLNPLALSGHKDHSERVREALSASGKVLIYGVGSNANGFFYYNPYGVSADKVVGFVDHYSPESSGHFKYMSLLKASQLGDYDFDLILNTQSKRLGAESIAEHIGGVEIIDVIPDIANKELLSLLNGKRLAVWMGKPDIFEKTVELLQKDDIRYYVKDRRESPEISEDEAGKITDLEDVQDVDYVIIPAQYTTPTFDRIYSALTEAGYSKSQIVGSHLLLSGGFYC